MRIKSVFILPRNELPKSPPDLAQALEDGFRQFVSKNGTIVSIAGDELGDLQSLCINLSGATINSVREPPVRTDKSMGSPAVTTREFALIGKPITVEGAQLEIELRAQNVHLNAVQLTTNELALSLNRAAAGTLQSTISRDALEELINKGAGKFAKRQGVTIEKVALDLAQPTPEAIDVRLTITARKLLFRPVLQLSGRMTIGDDLAVKFSDLHCHGEGPIASLACAAISAQFPRLEKRAIFLSALPLGQIELQDLALQLAGERILVSANFGEAAV